MSRLRITEIFLSLQGETRTVGIPTIFIRLTGCSLRCQYCDTAYAFQGGNWMTFEDIFSQLSSYKTKYITVTGGEPLAQKSCIPFLKLLCDQGYEVSLETSGALDVSEVDPRVVKVIDVKTPGSLESHKNFLTNFVHLSPHDQIKFVICSREDYEWSKELLQQYRLQESCEILFSPSFQQQEPGLLANWIIEDQLPVRLQIQLHKFLWGDVPGR